jgi:hypothetical protein
MLSVVWRSRQDTISVKFKTFSWSCNMVLISWIKWMVPWSSIWSMLLSNSGLSGMWIFFWFLQETNWIFCKNPCGIVHAVQTSPTWLQVTIYEHRKRNGYEWVIWYKQAQLYLLLMIPVDFTGASLDSRVWPGGKGVFGCRPHKAWPNFFHDQSWVVSKFNLKYYIWFVAKTKLV